jgi:hypothetical protein
VGSGGGGGVAVWMMLRVALLRKKVRASRELIGLGEGEKGAGAGHQGGGPAWHEYSVLGSCVLHRLWTRLSVPEMRHRASAELCATVLWWAL